MPWVQPAVNRKYLPDMELENGIIIEVKGRLTLEDRKKMLHVKEQYPELDIRFVFKIDNWLTKTKKHKYSDWCKKHDYPFAIGGIPKAWAKEGKKVKFRDLNR
jgi:hypothetical protein